MNSLIFCKEKISGCMLGGNVPGLPHQGNLGAGMDKGLPSYLRCFKSSHKNSVTFHWASWKIFHHFLPYHAAGRFQQMVSFRVHMQPLSRVKQGGCFKLVACHQLLGWSKKKKSAIMITLSRNCRGNSETQCEINLKCNLPGLLELVWPLYCKNCFSPWDDHIPSWSRFWLYWPDLRV